MKFESRHAGLVAGVFFARAKVHERSQSWQLNGDYNRVTLALTKINALASCQQWQNDFRCILTQVCRCLLAGLYIFCCYF